MYETIVLNKLRLMRKVCGKQLSQITILPFWWQELGCIFIFIARQIYWTCVNSWRSVLVIGTVSLSAVLLSPSTHTPTHTHTLPPTPTHTLTCARTQSQALSSTHWSSQWRIATLTRGSPTKKWDLMTNMWWGIAVDECVYLCTLQSLSTKETLCCVHHYYDRLCENTVYISKPL